jgi:hypothetical protein
VGGAVEQQLKFGVDKGKRQEKCKALSMLNHAPRH